MKLTRPLAGNWTCDFWISSHAPLTELQKLLTWAWAIQRSQVQFPAAGLEVAFFTTCPGWVSKCTYFQHSNLLHLTLTFIYWRRVLTIVYSCHICPNYFHRNMTQKMSKMLLQSQVFIGEHWTRSETGGWPVDQVNQKLFPPILTILSPQFLRYLLSTLRAVATSLLQTCRTQKLKDLRKKEMKVRTLLGATVEVIVKWLYVIIVSLC